MPAEEVAQTFRGLILPDYSGNLRLLSGSHPRLFNSAEKLGNIMHEAGILSLPAKLDNLVDASFIMKARP
jgi:hypothetical protein